MSNRYKLILSNRSIYREVDLSDSQTVVRVGTTTGCDVRLSSDPFFCNFELTLTLTNDVWKLNCSELVYVSADNISKRWSIDLKHGDHLHIKYTDSDNDLFAVDFMADFDYAEKDYHREIDISGTKQFTIGTDRGCDIVLKSEFLRKDILRVENQGETLLLKVQASDYGIYKNGQRVKEGRAQIQNRDFFSLGEYSFYFKERRLYTTESAGLQVNGLDTHILRESHSAMTYPKFNRSTRTLVKIPDEEIPVLDPPQKPQKPKKNLLMTLMPSLLMLTMVVLMRVMMAKSSGSGNLGYALMSAGMMAVGVVTSIVTFFTSKKEYKENITERTEKYNKYIDNKRQEIEGYRNQERELLNETYYDAKRDVKLVEDFSGDLFHRTPEDADYLSVRIGVGTVPAIRKIGYKKQEKFETDDELAQIPEQISEDYRNLEDAPIVCSFNKSDVIGVVGSKSDCYGILKNMTLDLATRQYFKDVKLFYLLPEEDQERFQWLRFLPHVVNDELNIRNIAYDTDSRTVLFEYLYRVLSSRSGKKNFETQFVIFAFDASGIKSHPLSQFLENANSLGVTFVFFDRDRSLLPQHCTELITLKSATEGVWMQTADSGSVRAFTYAAIADTTAARCAHRLAPVYCEEVSLEGTLTKSISLFELLEIYSVEDLDLNQRWASSAVDKSMAAPLGVKTKNDVVNLDLHEKYHGPHGLVAGTTGSGKSEILQSYILSMATLFHPYEVGFMIIDFKGGGMANQFKDLPHLMGTITNIDGREIDRSLRSIKAELLKRQEYFSDAGVNHIDKYIRLYKNGEVEKPLPHLIIIVDEFAELKAEQPEFMGELISAARIGRSLGVHLILATQKPAGQVNEQIWSNSRFKLCLKVQTKEDSNEVLKSPLAAEIREPGRAYLQVGNNEIFDLFQSGYSGAPEKSSEGSRQKEYSVSSLDLSGRRTMVFKQKRQQGDSGGRTQLEALVDYVKQFCEDQDIPRLPSICLPSLETMIDVPDTKLEKDLSVNLPIGIYDDPDSQYQGVASFKLGDDNLLVIGSSQTGKTNLLQVLIREMVSTYSPEEVSIYIADFGSMFLRNYEQLNHVGGVVTASENEKFRNLFKLLTEEIESRKQKISDSGLSSFRSYREAGYTDLPLIVFMLDNFSAFKELYAEDFEAQLMYLIREGNTYGITVVITNAQTTGLGYRYMANIGLRIAFTCNDRSEYSAVLERCRIEPRNVPGRALIAVDKTNYEVQTYISFHGKTESERRDAIRVFAESVNALYPDSHAKEIPSVPETLSISYIKKHYPDYNVRENLAFAMDYASVEMVSLNIFDQLILAVAGKNAERRARFVQTLLSDFRMNYIRRPVKLYVIDNYRKELADSKDQAFTELYSVSADSIKDVIDTVYEELEERNDTLEDEGAEALMKMPWLVVLVNNRQALDAMASSRDHENHFQDICKKYQALKVLFLLTDVNDASISSSAPQLLRKVKDEKKVLYFGAFKEMKIIDVYGSAARGVGALSAADDAFLITGENVARVKTIQEV